MPNIDDFFLIADNAGVRLEIVDGLAIWEPVPGLTHQTANDRIRRGIKSHSACLHYSDLHIKFPDGSDKRLDVSIFVVDPVKPNPPSRKFPKPLSKSSAKAMRRKIWNWGRRFT